MFLHLQPVRFEKTCILIYAGVCIICQALKKLDEQKEDQQGRSEALPWNID
jgi:hypothetical protein